MAALFGCEAADWGVVCLWYKESGVVSCKECVKGVRRQ